MDLVTQVVTIAAVVVGGLTSYVTNQLMERGQRRRELRTRWDARKLDAYAEYVGSARASIHASVLLYEVRTGLRSSPRGVKDLEHEHTEAGAAQALAFERVMLLAGDAVIDAAHAVQETVAAVGWQAREVVAGTLEEWRARNVTAFQAINRFHQHARADLGVSGLFEGEQHSARGLLLPATRTEQQAEDTATG